MRAQPEEAEEMHPISRLLYEQIVTGGRLRTGELIDLSGHSRPRVLQFLYWLESSWAGAARRQRPHRPERLLDRGTGPMSAMTAASGPRLIKPPGTSVRPWTGRDDLGGY